MHCRPMRIKVRGLMEKNHEGPIITCKANWMEVMKIIRDASDLDNTFEIKVDEIRVATKLQRFHRLNECIKLCLRLLEFRLCFLHQPSKKRIRLDDVVQYELTTTHLILLFPLITLLFETLYLPLKVLCFDIYLPQPSARTRALIPHE